MPDRIGAPHLSPSTAWSYLHRDLGPRRRLEPSRGFYDWPWLDGLASYASLRRLVAIVDPLVLLANLGGWDVAEILVAPDPPRSDMVVGIALPELLVDEALPPESAVDTCWRAYVGVEFPAGATFALGLRMELSQQFGTIYYDPGVAIDFADPSVIPWPRPDEEAPLFDRLLLLSSPDALHLDDCLPVLTDLVADDEGLRSRLIADLVAAAHGVATATTPVAPAGQLSLYAPSRWGPPRTDRSAEARQEYLDPFVQLGYAMVEHVLPDPEALGHFLVEETRLSRQALKAAGTDAAPSRMSLRSRLREAEATTSPRPHLLGMARRCEQESRRERPDPVVLFDTWTVPRPGLRTVDLRLTYTEWLLAAAHLGVIDPVSAIGVDAAVADPLNSRGLHPWLPAGQSRHAIHIRGLASDAWMAWEIDRPRATVYLARILALIPEQPPIYQLRWHGMPDSQLTRSFPAMQAWSGTELDDARAMVQELIDDEGALDGEAMFQRLLELELVLPGLDEYWLQTEAVTGVFEELRDMAGQFGEAFAEGFRVPFEGDPVATASRLWDLHQVNAPYLPLLSTVITAGALYGAGEYVATTIDQMITWLLDAADAIEQAVRALAQILDSSSSENGRLFGEAAGMMAKEAAEKLLAAAAPGWYAFELGRLLGPLLLDVILGAIFSAYVVPRLATGAALVLREAVGALDEVVDLRRVYAGFDRHDPDSHGGDTEADGGNGDGGDEPDADVPDSDEPDAGEPDADEPDSGEPDAGEPDAGEPDADEPDSDEPDADEPESDEPDADEPDADEAPPPPTPLERLAQALPPERSQWIQTGLPAKQRDRLLAALGDPARLETLLTGLALLSDLTPLTSGDPIFRSLIRAYTSSGVKLGIPETLGRVVVKETASNPARWLLPTDFELPAPPPSPSADAIQEEALEVIARHCNSYEELNEVSSPMGSARPGNTKDRLQDIWLRNKEALARALIGAWGLDEELWDNGQSMPVQRKRGQGRTEGRVRATRISGGDISRPEQVEGWLSRTPGDDLPRAVAREVRDNAALAYRTDASHLFPKSLGGPPELWNLIATSGRFNKSWMAWTENRLRSYFAEHGELYLRVELEWGEGNLPKKITYRAYKRGDHGGPEEVFHDGIEDLDPRLPLGKGVFLQPKMSDIERGFFPLTERVTDWN